MQRDRRRYRKALKVRTRGAGIRVRASYDGRWSGAVGQFYEARGGGVEFPSRIVAPSYR